MSSDLCSAIIGASFTLLGVIVGNVISFIQAKKQHDWHVNDASRLRVYEILDSRVTQSEIYVGAFTEDFRSLMHDIEFILSSTDPGAIAQRSQRPYIRKDLLDLKVFAHGPAISALNDNKLKEHYEQMDQSFENLKKLFAEICHKKIDLGEQLDYDNYSNLLKGYWSQFAKSLGNFYARLDKLRTIIPN